MLIFLWCLVVVDGRQRVECASYLEHFTQLILKKLFSAAIMVEAEGGQIVKQGVYQTLIVDVEVDVPNETHNVNDASEIEVPKDILDIEHLLNGLLADASLRHKPIVVLVEATVVALSEASPLLRVEVNHPHLLKFLDLVSRLCFTISFFAWPSVDEPFLLEALVGCTLLFRLIFIGIPLSRHDAEECGSHKCFDKLHFINK